MRWIVKIEKRNNERILLKINPMNESIVFFGQYKINNMWVNFTYDNCDMYCDLDVIQNKLLNICNVLSKRVDKYNDLEKSFPFIKTIEILNEWEINSE